MKFSACTHLKSPYLRLNYDALASIQVLAQSPQGDPCSRTIMSGSMSIANP